MMPFCMYAQVFQECDPAVPIVEEVFKKLISGESIARMPLFGRTTVYYRWLKTCKRQVLS